MPRNPRYIQQERSTMSLAEATAVEVVRTGRLAKSTVENLATFAKRPFVFSHVDNKTRILLNKMQTARPVKPSIEVYDADGSTLGSYENDAVTIALVRKCLEAGVRVQFIYHCTGIGLIYTCDRKQNDDKEPLQVTTKDLTVYPPSGHAWRQPLNDSLEFTITDLSVPSGVIFHLERYITE